MYIQSKLAKQAAIRLSDIETFSIIQSKLLVTAQRYMANGACYIYATWFYTYKILKNKELQFNLIHVYKKTFLNV